MEDDITKVVLVVQNVDGEHGRIQVMSITVRSTKPPRLTDVHVAEGRVLDVTLTA